MGRRSQSDAALATLIGSRLSWLRARKGLTQVELGEALGISRAAISQWETGDTFPSYDAILAASKVFQVRPGWIVFGEPPDPAESDGEYHTRLLREARNGLAPLALERPLCWRIPDTHIPRSRSGAESDLVVMTVPSVTPFGRYEVNDKVIVDLSDREPEPEGYFFYWDRGLAVVALLRSVMGNNTEFEFWKPNKPPMLIQRDDVEVIGRLLDIILRRRAE